MVYFFLAVLLCFHALPAAGVPAGTVRLSGQFRGFPIPLFSVDLPPVFRKFHSTIFCALRRLFQMYDPSGNVVEIYAYLRNVREEILMH